MRTIVRYMTHLVDSPIKDIIFDEINFLITEKIMESMKFTVPSRKDYPRIHTHSVIYIP